MKNLIFKATLFQDTFKLVVSKYMLSTEAYIESFQGGSQSIYVIYRGVHKKFPMGESKFRHNRVTSQINFIGSAEGRPF